LDIMVLYSERRSGIYHLAAAILCLILFTAALIAERIRLDSRRRIPLRISVTGTRGKSSVVRLLASIFRESGLRIAAKTTGSKPVFIHTDGREEEIRRRGKPTILEQKDVIRAAVREKSQGLIVEAMGIRPEILSAEVEKIIRPQVLIITNVRLDHAADMGADRGKIAASFSAAIPRGAAVFIPEEEVLPVFYRAAAGKGAKLIPVKALTAGHFPGPVPAHEFEPNIRLAAAVARHFLVSERDIAAGIEEAGPDFGSLKIWEMSGPDPGKSWRFVNAFAANDPSSTLEILEKLKGLTPGRQRLVGLLNLRRERADRSLQWKRALQASDFSRLDRVYVVGDQAGAFARGSTGGAGPELTVIRGKIPEDVSGRVTASEPDGALVVGMGNMGGLGRSLVEFWDKEGTRSDF
jgi:poly-gamma-glutamate synthase PgsB/CapB